MSVRWLRALTMADPVRTLLAVLSTTFAAGGAILTLNTAYRVNQYLALRTEDGLVLTLLNASESPEGPLKYQNPPTFSAGLGDRLRIDYPAVEAVSAVEFWYWERIQVGDTLYRPRLVMGAEPDLARVVGLEIVAGRFISEADIAEKRNAVVLGSEAAEILFGTPDQATGKRLLRDFRQVDRRRGDGGTDWRWGSEELEIVGVFRDLSPLLRDLYDVADFIVPLTICTDPAMAVSCLRMRVTGEGESEARSRLLALVRAHLGEGTAASIWRGKGPEADSAIRRTRRERASISFFFGLFAAAALLVGGVGLMAVMMADSLEHERQTGIRRCLGATRGALILAGGARALRPALSGLVIGTGAAAALSRATLRAVYPILYADAGVFEAQRIPEGAATQPILIVWAAMILLAALAGTLPQSAILRARPSENLRE